MQELKSREQEGDVLMFLLRAVRFGVEAARLGRIRSTGPAVSAPSGSGGGAAVIDATPAPAAPRPGVHVTSVIPDELVPFFECVQNHESARAGRYSAVQQPSGSYRGAYQMDANYWRSYAPPEWKYLAGSRNWETAPPEVQDAAALAGYRARGGQPWNGSGC